MRERFFEQGKMDDKKAIERELSDHGINDPKDWRKALDLETPLEGEEGFEESDKRSFSKLLTHLEGDKERVSDREKIKKFSETENNIERLELLRTMSLGDAIASIRDYSSSEGSYKYLADRLEFYQDLVSGTAVRKRKEQEWNSKKGEYVEVIRGEPIEASNSTPETVRLGVLRDMMFASMIGTPEMAIYKITSKRCKEGNLSTGHMPELKGYHSGIHERSVGYAYPFLQKLYKKAHRYVEHKVEGQKIDPQALEHKGVMLASRWLTEAMNYNDPDRSPHSPYARSAEEAVAWARLGEHTKKQLRGMRRKIQNIDLHNIERFIGKSGDDKYDPERKRLFAQIKFFKESSDQDKKQEFTTKENGFGVEKQQRWLERETERLKHKFEKSKAELEKINLPEEEKELQLQSVIARHEDAMAKLQADYETQSTRLQERTPEQLLADLEQRQTLVNQRHEKRKSLAQKALDLHFRFNHAGGDYNSKVFAGMVDWINYAPMGTIKRSHRMLQKGISEESVMELATADIICGARGVTREDLEEIKKLVIKAKGQDREARNKLSAMMKVGNIVSYFDHEVSMAEVAELATKNFNGMTEALRQYSFDEVKAFMDQNLNLHSVITAKKVTEKHGPKLENDVMATMAAHNIDGLDDALNSFDLGEVMTLLTNDVNLPVAIAVLENTKQFNYELSIDQISRISKNVSDINDFTSALRALPLGEVEKLLTVGVPYHEFGKVKSTLEKHGHASDFTSTLTVAQKLIRNNEYDNLDNALQLYSLREIDEIITKGTTLASVLEIRQPLEEKGISTTIQETIQFAQYAGDRNKGYNFTQSIETFGIENVRRIVSKSCRLDKAIEVENHINNSSSYYGQSEIPQTLKDSLKKGGIDVVIAIAKAGNVEVVIKTIEAGFTVEEITRFPFLISPLVTKK